MISRSLTRSFASIATNAPGPYAVFDRRAKQLQKDRAVLRKNSATVDYLRDEVADRMLERFEVCFVVLVLVRLSFNTECKGYQAQFR